MIHQRTSGCFNTGDKQFVALTPDEENTFSSQVIAPIIAEGDAIGAVVMTTKDTHIQLGEVERKLAAAAAAFLGLQMEQ